ncbi:MAG TPA: glycosyltransferase family 4 protein [Candidatus Dojkabacteria bacterium]|nr:glycosyltransferase family 4 protein [Candidatus Dojkabacteria bacterium]
MKKVLIITSRSYPSIGGVEKVVDQLATGLAKRGYEIRVITNFFRTRKGGIKSLGEYFKQSWTDHLKALLGIGYMMSGYSIVETYFIFPGISAIRTLLSLILFPFTLIHFLYQYSTFRPAVVNIHFGDNVIVYAILCKVLFKHTTLISSFHGSDIVVFPRRSPLQRYLLRQLIKISDKVVFVSKYLEDEAVKTIKDSISNSIVIHNSSPEPIIVDNVDRNSNRLLYVGRVVQNKGVDILLQAFMKLKNKFSDLELYIAGDGDQMENLRKQYDDKSIKFLGFITDPVEIAKLYKSSSIFIAPSRFESFGKVALEAMSYGCLAVTSNVGGFKEVVNDGETGLLFESENIDNLVAVLDNALTDVEKRKRIVSKASQEVKLRFSEKVFLDNYERIVK